VWRYYAFGTDRASTDALPQESCFQCHEKSAAVEHSFVQFYPQLLSIAKEKKTIKEGVHLP